jgi:hypothetical protein
MALKPLKSVRNRIETLKTEGVVHICYVVSWWAVFNYSDYGPLGCDIVQTLTWAGFPLLPSTIDLSGHLRFAPFL